MPKNEHHKVTTWADSFAIWHCAVVVDKIGNAGGVLDTARDAIADEIRQRSNSTIEQYLASERYQVECVVDGEETPDGIRYVFREIETADPVTVSLTINVGTVTAVWTDRDDEFRQRAFSDYSLDEIRQSLREEIGGLVVFAEPTRSFRG